MKTCPYCGTQMGDETEYCGKCGARMGSPVGQPYPPQPPPPCYPYPTGYPEIRFAGFWIRFVAAIIDGFILGIAFIPLNVAASVTRSTASAVLIRLFIALVEWAYAVIMLGAFGATLGKMALGLKVVRDDFGPVGYGTAALREIIGKFISGLICLLGYISAGFDRRKQAWHDHIAKTLVIYR